MTLVPSGGFCFSPWQGGRGCPPAGDGACSRPGGRGGHQPFEGWSNAPPIFSFYSRNKKRKRAVHGPKEKNKGTRLRGRGGESGIRQACPCPRRSASGGFGGCRIDKRQFWCGAVSAFFPEPPFSRRCCRRGGPMCPPQSVEKP